MVIGIKVLIDSRLHLLDKQLLPTFLQLKNRLNPNSHFLLGHKGCKNKQEELGMTDLYHNKYAYWRIGKMGT